MSLLVITTTVKALLSFSSLPHPRRLVVVSLITHFRVMFIVLLLTTLLEHFVRPFFSFVRFTCLIR